VHQEARYSSRGYAYGMKMTSGDELPEFLALNGRSLAHATRGFWRNGEGGPVVAGGFAGRRSAHRGR